MLDLSPIKVLVVLVVALLLVGPDKVPQLARQLGAAWTTLKRWHERVEAEVRSVAPDLPSTQEIARAVRSPVAFLDSLSSMDTGSDHNGASPGGPLSGDHLTNGSGPGGPDGGGLGRADGAGPSAAAVSANGTHPAHGAGGGRTREHRGTTGRPFLVPEDPGTN